MILSDYATVRANALTGALTDFDRDVARAIYAGCPVEARPIAHRLGRTSWSNTHLALLRLEAHGIILVDHPKRCTGRLAPDIAVIDGDICRMTRIEDL